MRIWQDAIRVQSATANIPETVVFKTEFHPSLVTHFFPQLLLVQARRQFHRTIRPASDGVDQFRRFGQIGCSAHFYQGFRIVEVEFGGPHYGETTVGPAGVGHEIVVLIQILAGEVVGPDDGTDVDVVLSTRGPGA